MDAFNLDSVMEDMGAFSTLSTSKSKSRSESKWPRAPLRRPAAGGDGNDCALVFCAHETLARPEPLSALERAAANLVEPTQAYRNLRKTLSEWRLVDAPPFHVLARYATTDKSLNLRRDAHMIAIWIADTYRKDRGTKTLSFRNTQTIVAM